MKLDVSRLCGRIREEVWTEYLSDPHGKQAIPGLANVQCTRPIGFLTGPG